MKEREAFLDKLRVAAACAVVLLHTVTGVLNVTDMSPYPLENKIFLILVDVSCWCVPVFLLISGYLFLNPDREISVGKMLMKYCRRVVLALLLFGTSYAFLELVATEKGVRLDMSWEAFLMVLQGKSWSHMWYLYLILVLYLLTPGLKWVLSRIPRPAVYTLLGILLVECSILPFLFRLFEREERAFLPVQGIYLFYYLCGYLFADSITHEGEEIMEEAGKEYRRHKMRPGYGLSLLSLFLMFAMAGIRWFGSYPGQMAYNDPFTVVLSLALFGASFLKERQKPGGTGLFSLETSCTPGNMSRIPWGSLADLSFAVYLIHPVFLNIAYKFFGITLLSFPLGLSLPLFFLGTLLLATFFSWGMKKMPLLKKYVL